MLINAEVRWEMGDIAQLLYCRLKTGDGLRETGDERQKTGDRRQNTGDGIRETGDERQNTGDRRQEMGEFNSILLLFDKK